MLCLYQLKCDISVQRNHKYYSDQYGYGNVEKKTPIAFVLCWKYYRLNEQDNPGFKTSHCMAKFQNRLD